MDVGASQGVRAILEQIICVQAGFFVGTMQSTFTQVTMHQMAPYVQVRTLVSGDAGG